jgi:hypothetical protein
MVMILLEYIYTIYYVYSVYSMYSIYIYSSRVKNIIYIYRGVEVVCIHQHSRYNPAHTIARILFSINKNCQYGEREVPYWLAV